VISLVKDRTAWVILPHVVISTSWAQANCNSLIAPDGHELLQNFQAKAGTILNGATVCISPLIRGAVQELMDEVPTRGMNCKLMRNSESESKWTTHVQRHRSPSLWH
jgi:hypothetical protein